MKRIIAQSIAAFSIALMFAGCVSNPSVLSNNRETASSDVGGMTEHPDTTEAISPLDEEIASTQAPVSGKILDPFDGIAYAVTGISPFCKIEINTQNCSKEVQEYVTYSFDKETYENGDTAVVTATIDENISSDDYTLKISSETIAVERAPYYIESLDGIDLTLLKTELNDFIVATTAQGSSMISSSAFYQKYTGDYLNFYPPFSKAESVTSDQAFLMSVKRNKRAIALEEGEIINTLAIPATCVTTMEGLYGSKKVECKGAIYVIFYLDNIICYPDGGIGFGTTDPEMYDIHYKSTIESMNSLVSECIDSYRTDYNVTKITDTQFIEY